MMDKKHPVSQKRQFKRLKITKEKSKQSVLGYRT